MDQGYDVRFADGQIFSPADRAGEATGYRQALAEHHGTGAKTVPAWCCCMGTDNPETKLYIGYREAAGTYYLARYPNTGSSHATDCEWYELPRDASGLDGYDTSVVKTLEDGSLKVRLKRPLRRSLVATERDAPAPEPGPKATGRRSQTAMTTRGLLDLLWEQADLHHWHPGMLNRRTPGIVHFRLVQAARRIKASRDLLEECTLFFLGGLQPRDFRELCDRNRRVLRDRWAGNTNKEQRHIIVVGTVQGVQEAATGFRVKLDGAPSQKINVEMSKKILDGLSRGFPPFVRAIADKRQDRERVVAIMHCQIEAYKPDEWARLEVIAGAFISTTDHWIPVESSYERDVAHKLVEDNRAFLKPLRYDATQDVVFPDFLLTDAGPPLLPMEVFGRDDPDYLARQAAKRDLYPEVFPDAPLWEWDVSDVPIMPPFPPKRGRRHTPSPSPVSEDVCH